MSLSERVAEARAWLASACSFTCALPDYPLAREDLAVGSGLLAYNTAVALCIAQTRGDLDSPFATASFGLLACEVVFAIAYIRIRARREMIASYNSLDP
jgi:hypothetical protein